MDYKKAKEICQDEIRKAEMAKDTEKVDQLNQELAAIEAAIKEDERLVAVANSESAKSIKLRDVLSDYYLKRVNRLNKAFIGRLKETALREPVTVDQYGTYRQGLFTFGSFIVEVKYDAEERVWELTIYGDNNMPVPHNVVKEARLKFIPDHCVMAELFYGRNVAKKGSVTLFEVPGSNEPEEDAEDPETPEATE